jgi:hypothetical protein
VNVLSPAPSSTTLTIASLGFVSLASRLPVTTELPPTAAATTGLMVTVMVKSSLARNCPSFATKWIVSVP